MRVYFQKQNLGRCNGSRSVGRARLREAARPGSLRPRCQRASPRLSAQAGRCGPGQRSAQAGCPQRWTAWQAHSRLVAKAWSSAQSPGPELRRPQGRPSSPPGPPSFSRILPSFGKTRGAAATAPPTQARDPGLSPRLWPAVCRQKPPAQGCPDVRCPHAGVSQRRCVSSWMQCPQGGTVTRGRVAPGRPGTSRGPGAGQPHGGADRPPPGPAGAGGGTSGRDPELTAPQ